MDYSHLSCPLCCKQNFFTSKSLREHLSSYVWDYLLCPVCDESIIGVQELWFHLEKHIQSEENVGMECENSRIVAAPSASVLPDATLCNQKQDIACALESASVLLCQVSGEASQTDYTKQDNKKEEMCLIHLNGTDVTVSHLNEENGQESLISTKEASSVFVCGGCSECKPTFNEMKDHALQAHDITSIPTLDNVIGLHTNSEVSQEQNSVNSTEESVHLSCEACGKILISQKDLAFHQKNRCCELTKTSRFDCDECGKQYPTMKVLITHRERFHLKLKTCLCEDCGMRFYDIYGLKAHMKLHRNIKPFSCNECQKQFVWAADLRRHQGIHTGKMTHICEICGKGYLNGHQLSIHIRSHTGDRPYSCSICGASFMSKSNLRSHSSVHTPAVGGEFTCKYCSKVFSTRIKLYHHNRMHIKPFKCKVCGHGFTCTRDVKQHMRTHGKDYKCRFCHLQFTQAAKLLKHESTHGKS